MTNTETLARTICHKRGIDPDARILVKDSSDIFDICAAYYATNWQVVAKEVKEFLDIYLTLKESGL